MVWTIKRRVWLGAKAIVLIAGGVVLLLGIQERRSFALAMQESYGRDIRTLWAEFVEETRSTVAK